MMSGTMLALLTTTIWGQVQSPASAPSAAATTGPTAPAAPPAGGWEALNAPRLLDLIPPVAEARKALEDRGLKLSLSTVLTFQAGTGGAGSFSAPNIFGEATFYSPNHNAFRTTDNTYLGLTMDFGKLTGLEAINGLSLYIQGEIGAGLSYNRNVGSAVASPNTNLLTNAYATQLTEFWLDWTKTIDKLTLRGRIGSINFGRTFDTNAYMGDGTQQFLNALLANNPFFANATRSSINYGLGVEGEIDYQFTDWLTASYASGVYSTNYGYNYSQFTSAFEKTGANGRITVPNPAYNGGPEDPHILWLNEISLKTLLLDFGNGKMPGNYRFGLMYTDNPAQDLRFNTYDGSLRERYKSQSTAFYLSFDQMIYKAKADSDTQGLGVFFQFAGTGLDWAWPPGQIPLSTYFAWGLQYTGLIPTREKDATGFAYAICSYNEHAAHNQVYGNGSAELSDTQVLEWYYKINVFDWFSLSPDLQYIIRPDGVNNHTDAFVVGLRAMMSF